jgi:hypothetical protein
MPDLLMLRYNVAGGGEVAYGAITAPRAIDQHRLNSR